MVDEFSVDDRLARSFGPSPPDSRAELRWPNPDQPCRRQPMRRMRCCCEAFCSGRNRSLHLCPSDKNATWPGRHATQQWNVASKTKPLDRKITRRTNPRFVRYALPLRTGCSCGQTFTSCRTSQPFQVATSVPNRRDQIVTFQSLQQSLEWPLNPNCFRKRCLFES